MMRTSMTFKDHSNMRQTGQLSALALTYLLTGCATSSPDVGHQTVSPSTHAKVEVVSVSEVKWDQLNPARGAASPLAATLWGDRAGTEATGFLFRPVDGFESPPHIHNVTYRGVVIRGLVHNDAPDATQQWMSPGSYWSQPKGGTHITAARGDTLAYIEIDEGPYLVGPVEDAFESADKSKNLDAAEIVWVDASTVASEASEQASTSGAEVAVLWGNPKDPHLGGFLIKLPAGSVATIRGDSTFQAVVIQGQQSFIEPGENRKAYVKPGSYARLPGEVEHELSCKVGGECIAYVRVKGGLDIRTIAD